MHYRVPFLVALGTIGAAGLLDIACSTNVNVGPDADSGPDTSTGSEGGPTDSGGKPDAKKIPVCTMNPIKGECDLVSQNCPSGKECVSNLPDGGFGTICQDPGTGALAEGEACVNGADNPCVAGLQCQAGRCSKPCCMGDPNGSSVCGVTKEGYIGVCDLNIVDPKNNPLYSVCEYAKPCEPFGVQPCGMGQTCLVKDGVGTAACSDIFGAGKTVGTPCTAANDCQDGMMCVGSGTNVCTIMCWNKASKTPPPFDGGALDGGVGGGGCPAKQTCQAVNWGGALPDWLGTCK